MPKKVVAVMGPDTCSEAVTAAAFEVGKAVAEAGHVLLTGGRNRGIMDAASKGAKAGGGLTVGVLPGTDSNGMSDAVDIPIFTGMDQGRNNINALSGDVMVAIGMGPGTAAEVSLALKAGKHVVLLEAGEEAVKFFAMLRPGQVHVAKEAAEVSVLVARLL